MRDLNEIQCFVKAVELKSLTAAARALDLPKSSVSRKIQALEARMGLTLLTRTTRALHLTEAGRLFFERSAVALKELDSAETALDGSHQAVEGLLRITGPHDFVIGPFNQLVATFMRQYQKIRVELVLTDRLVDLIGEGFDFAFRAGELEDSTLLARRLRREDAVFFASPEYLKARGTPRTLADLDEHECIGFAPEGQLARWPLQGPAGKKEFAPRGRLVTSSLLSAKETMLRGMGVALLPTGFMQDELKAKTARIVLEDWRVKGTAFHLVYPGQRFLAPKMRAFIEHATKHYLP